jgi:hypothetical protein
MKKIPSNLYSAIFLLSMSFCFYVILSMSFFFCYLLIFMILIFSLVTSCVSTSYFILQYPDYSSAFQRVFCLSQLPELPQLPAKIIIWIHFQFMFQRILWNILGSLIGSFLCTLQFAVPCGQETWS